VKREDVLYVVYYERDRWVAEAYVADTEDWIHKGYGPNEEGALELIVMTLRFDEEPAP
jgi:hypothetical protein